MKRNLFGIALILISSVAFADGKATINSPFINLGEGTVPPAQVVQVSFEKLVPNIEYDVTCKIFDENNYENKVIMGTQTVFMDGALGHFYLNGKDLGRTTYIQYTLPDVANILIATKMSRGLVSLVFTNADQDDSVSYSCQARPSV